MNDDARIRPRFAIMVAMRSGRTCLLVLLGCVFVSACGPARGETEGAGSESAPIGWNAARSSADGRALVISFTGGAEYASDDPCTTDYRADVDEDGDSVVVGVIAIDHGSVDDGALCSALGYAREVTAPLAEPLGDRVVISKMTGRAQPVFDGSTLVEPSWIPDGWMALGEGVAFPTADASEVWSRGWGVPRPVGGDPFACTIGIALIQGVPNAMVGLPVEMGGQTQLGSYDIDGNVAIHSATPERFTQRLTWTSGDVSFAVVAGACDGNGGVDIEVMLKFARNLHARN